MSTEHAAHATGAEAWRSVHPLTPILRSWSAIATLVAIVTLRAEDVLRPFVGSVFHVEGEDSGGFPLGHASSRQLILALAALVGLLVLLLLFNWVAWRATSFRVTDTAVEVRRGVLIKHHRHARLDRVQAIDLEQPLVPRMFGLAVLSFDVAGSGSAHLRISMLKRADAEALRESMLAAVREARAAQETSPEQPGPGASQQHTAVLPTSEAQPFRAPGAAPERARQAPRTLGGRLLTHLTQEGTAIGADLTETISSTFAAYGPIPHANADGRIVHVPPHRVLLARLLRFSTLFALVWLLLGLGSLVVGVTTDNVGVSWTVAFPAFITAFGVLNNTVQSALKQANFSAALTPDGLLITQGVTSTQRRVIPLDRIQAVGVEQPLLWRPFGWWRAHYNVATHGSTEASLHSTVLLPVGTAQDALTLMSLALPLTPEGEQDQELSEALLLDAMSSSPKLLRNQPVSSKWLDVLSWRVNGWKLTPSLTLTRRGRLRRRVECMPHARLQSLSLHTGPVQRHLGLSRLRLHSTSGPLGGVMPHQNASEARELFYELARIARDARHAEQERGAMARAR